MDSTQSRISEPEIVREADGKITGMRVHFGPHHFFQLRRDGDRLKCAIGATHHGFEADASEVPSEFERLVNEIQRIHPDVSF